MINPIAELENFKDVGERFPISSLIEAITPLDKKTHLYAWNFRSKQLWDDTESRVVTHGVTLRAALDYLYKIGCEFQSIVFE
jgi:hypothetical protein